MPRSVRQSPKDSAKLARADELIHKKGDLRAGLAIYRDVLKRFPDDPELLYHLGAAELMAGHVESARKRLLKSAHARPTPGVHRALAKTYDLDADADAALEHADKGLALAPHDPDLIAAKADALFVKGDYDAAHALLAPLVDAREDRPPAPGVALAFGRLCHRVDRLADGVHILEGVRSRSGTDAQQRAAIDFRLADLLDRLGEHDRAFEAAAGANRARAHTFDPHAFAARVAGAIHAWTPEGVRALPAPAGDTSRPIIIVGMPRSGTSLAERIIAAHPRVAPGGERGVLARIAVDLGADPAPPPILESPDALSKPALARASRRYLKDLRDVDRHADRVTDKMPTNFLNLGLAAAICPHARIVHCVRDPRDTCLSCFFQSFADGLPFAANLGHLAVAANAERRLMAHWKQVLNVPILDLIYEDLVADLEGISRELLDFLDLGWDPACETFWQAGGTTATASQDQVRRPVYTSSVGRWRHYERHLGPLLDALEPDTPG